MDPNAEEPSMTTRTAVVLAFLLAVFVPVTARAQSDAGPTFAAARVALTGSPLSSNAAPATLRLAAAPATGGLSRASKIMIFGGAVFLTGAIVGDDVGTVLMVAGGLTALYGLYVYLDRPLDRDAFAPPRTDPLIP